MRAVARVVLLTSLWLLAWGEASLANVLSGAVVSVALLYALPPSTPSAARARIDPLAVARLAVYVTVQLVTSNVVVTREIVRRRTRTTPGVLAHVLDRPSEHVVTVMTSVIALSPGTMVVDVDHTSSTIYVHFLFLRDVEAARSGLERLERLAREAVASDQRAQPREAT